MGQRRVVTEQVYKRGYLAPSSTLSRAASAVREARGVRRPKSAVVPGDAGSRRNGGRRARSRVWLGARLEIAPETARPGPLIALRNDPEIELLDFCRRQRSIVYGHFVEHTHELPARAVPATHIETRKPLDERSERLGRVDLDAAQKKPHGERGRIDDCNEMRP